MLPASDYDLRTATSDDAMVITSHRNQMFAEMDVGTAQTRAQMDSYFQPWVRSQLAARSYLGWFACYDERIVAGAGLWLMDWAPAPDGYAGAIPYLMNVYTEPDHRKQGLARLLVSTIIAYCRQQGYPRLRLHASEFGRPLYLSLGFRNNNEMQLNLEQPDS